MRVRALVAAAVLCASAVAASTPAAGQVKAPDPGYVWAHQATLIVTGTIDSVDAAARTATLRVAKTLAGSLDARTLTFTPTTHPMCKVISEDKGAPAPDVHPDAEVALFLVKGEGDAFQVVDHGYAKVRLDGARGLPSAPLASVERLVAIMKTADLDARDRAMIECATADEQFLRRAACDYVREALGVASPKGRTLRRDAAVEDAHRAAVGRFADELAALVVRENGSEPYGAALEGGIL